MMTMTDVLCTRLHFLNQVAICDDTEFVKNQVDATLDEECFIGFQRLVQLHQVARTVQQVSASLHHFIIYHYYKHTV